MSQVGQQGGMALGDIGDMVEAMPSKDVSRTVAAILQVRHLTALFSLIGWDYLSA